MAHPLAVVQHTLLTSNVLELLAEQSVHTVVDFVQCNTNQLKTLANLTDDQVAKLKNYLISEYGPRISDGLTAKNQELYNGFLPTGLASLDILLGGGLVTGNLVELSGPTASGKTLLANSILIHFVRTHRVPVCYFNTKNACSPSQWYRLMKAGIGKPRQPGDHQNHTTEQAEIAEAMSMIYCEQVRSLPDLMTLLRSLLMDADNHRLLFVDSLTALLLPFQGATYKSGLAMMAEALTLLRQLASVQRKIVLLETIVLNDRNHKPSEMIRIVKHTSEPIPSTISRYWPTFPTIRLFIFQHWAAEQAEYEIVLLKSTQHRSGRHVSCMLQLGT